MNKYFRAKYFFNSYIKGYLKELSLTLQSSRKYSKAVPKKFLLFTGGRTGSTLLLSLLNHHPEIEVEGEILKGRMLNPLKFITKKTDLATKEVYGFKLLSYQLRDVQTKIKRPKDFLEDLIQQGYQIIYLERKNKVYQSLSVTYAMQKDLWHSTQKKQISQEKINLEVGQFEYMLQEIEKLGAFEKKVLHGLPYLHLRYEQDLENAENHPATLLKICEYLDIEPINNESELRKLLPNNISKFVQNSSEIANYLKRTGTYEFVE